MEAFSHGPFHFIPGSALRVAGIPSHRWSMAYGALEIGNRVIPDSAPRSAIVEEFGSARGTFTRAQQTDHIELPPSRDVYVVDLVRSTQSTGERGEVIASFDAYAPIAGMSRGLIDDRFETWAVSDRGVVPMTPQEFERLAAANGATAGAIGEARALRAARDKPLPFAWLAGMLPEHVLTREPREWGAPTSWEIRHVVGEGSFTGVTGAAAAALVGVTPQNFRKYTAADGARTRQQISYAMWHLLLHKLGVQHA